MWYKNLAELSFCHNPRVSQTDRQTVGPTEGQAYGFLVNAAR